MRLVGRSAAVPNHSFPILVAASLSPVFVAVAVATIVVVGLVFVVVALLSMRGMARAEPARRAVVNNERIDMMKERIRRGIGLCSSSLNECSMR